MRKSLAVLLAGLLILGSLAGCARAEFEVSSITITPSEVVAGEPFTVSAEITNVGDAENVYTATLTIDGGVITNTKEVTVGAGAAETLSFTCAVETPGTHSLELNGLATIVSALRTAKVSDPIGDVSSDAKDKRGIDLKAVRAFMDEDYLYVAIQIYDVFEPSLPRNYFIALDFDNDGRDEYHFGVRPDGSTWVFDHRIDKNNWEPEDTWGVLAAGKGDTIEVIISKEDYEIPSSILVYCRVTEGGPTVDQTEWFKVP